MNIDQNIANQALNIALGTDNVPAKCTEENKNLFEVLLAIGIATYNKKGESIVFKSENKLQGNNVLSADDIEDWKAMSFTIDFSLGFKKHPCKVSKCGGDLYATIGDVDGRHSFGAIVVCQDSRSPWVLLEGDNRPSELTFTYKNMPNQEGKCIPCTGWTKSSNGSWLYDGEFTIKDCNKVVKFILGHYFGRQFDRTVVSLNNVQRTKFIDADTMSTSIDLGDVQIVKSCHDRNATVYLGEVQFGSLTLEDVCLGNSKITLVMDDPNNKDRFLVQKAVWDLVAPINNTGSFGTSVGEEIIKSKKIKVKGKKQFALKQ